MKLWVAMSGGVDSSAAACLLKQQGFEVEGAMLRLLRPQTAEAAAAQETDIEDARRVARALDIPFHLLQETDLFEETVIRDFIDSYRRGETPNPCVTCNRQLKFGRLLEAALAAGADGLATGHYVRRQTDPDGRPFLLKGKDTAKDQSYMLWSLNRRQLEYCHFPLGDFSKVEIRQLAEQAGLPVASKQDSQDICFIPDGDYAAFIESRTGFCAEPGPFIDRSGHILGSHRGYLHYTIGQRKGLGLASEAPLFVTELRPQTNEVVLSHGEGLFSRTVFARDIQLQAALPARVQAKLRYRQPAQPARVRLQQDCLTVVFDEPQRAAAAGQSLVLYDGERLLGGGIICGHQEGAVDLYE